MIETRFYAAKFVGIIFAVCLHFVVALHVGYFLRGDPPEREELDRRNVVVLWFELLLEVVLVALAAYGIRQLTKMVPFPLDGAGGFEYARLREASTSVMFGFALLATRDDLKTRMLHLLGHHNGPGAPRTPTPAESPAPPALGQTANLGTGHPAFQAFGLQRPHVPRS